MKIRTDFVSNSSSSSFVLCGKVFSFDEVKKALLDGKSDEEIFKIVDENPEEYGNQIEELLENIGYDEIFRKVLERAGLDAICSGEFGDEDQVLIGLPPDKMTDEQTLGNFKDVILHWIQVFGLKAEKKDIDFISGGSGPDGFTFFESNG